MHLSCLEADFRSRSEWGELSCQTCQQAYEEEARSRLGDIAVREMGLSRLGDLANSYYELGDVDIARDLYKRGLVTLEKHCGADHQRVARMLNRLAACSLSLGNASTAKAYLERALGIWANHYVREYPTVANILCDLNTGICRLNNKNVAKDIIQPARTAMEEYYGCDCLAVAHILHKFGKSHEKFGDISSAKRMFRRTRKILARHHGVEHPLYARATAHLLPSLRAGKAPCAFTDSSGGSSSDLETMLDNLSCCQTVLGELRTGLGILESAVLQSTPTAYGRDHYHVARVLKNLAICQLRLSEKELLDSAKTLLDALDGDRDLQRVEALSKEENKLPRSVAAVGPPAKRQCLSLGQFCLPVKKQCIR